MKHFLQRHRTGLAALLIVPMIALLVVTGPGLKQDQAGADSPGGWGAGGTAMNGDCNMLFQTEGPVGQSTNQGYVQNITCQLALPTADPLSTIPMLGMSTDGNNYDESNTDGYSDGINGGTQSHLDPSLNNCSEGRNVWMAISYPSTFYYACTAGTAAGDLGTTMPSWLETSGGTPVGYFNIYYEHASSPVSGYYSAIIKETLTIGDWGGYAGGCDAYQSSYCNPSTAGGIAADGSCTGGYSGPVGGYPSDGGQAQVETNTASIATAGFITMGCEGIGGANPPVPTEFYAGGTAAPPAQPCTLVSVTGDSTGPTSDGSAKPYTFTYTGAAEEILADPQDGDGGATITQHGETFTGDSVFDTTPTSPDTLSVITNTGNVVDPEFFCWDGTQWNSWGTAETAEPATNTPPGDSGGSFDLGTCFGASGMTLTNPVSWITGAAKDGLCIAQWLFVPSTNSITALTNEFGFSSSGSATGTCGTTAPSGLSGSVSQWLGAGFHLITEGPSCAANTIATEEASGETSSYLSTGDTVHGGGKTFTVSLPASIDAATSSSSVSPFFVIILALLSAVFAVAFFFAIKTMIQWILSKMA